MIVRSRFATLLAIASCATLLARLDAAAAPPPLCVNPGGTGGCFASIQAAVNAAPKSGTVDVAAGTYVENVAVAKNLVLRGAGAGSTVIDGNSPAGPALVLLGSSRKVAVSGLTLTNGTVGAAIDSGVKAAITDCAVTGNASTGVALGTRSKLTLTRSTVSANGGIGILTGNDQRHRARLDVIDSTVASNGANGIHAPVTTVRVIRSTVADNAQRGIEAHLLTVDRSTISGNDGGGIFLHSFPGQTTISNSTISGNSRPGATGAALFAIRKVMLDHVTVANNSGANGAVRLSAFSTLRSTIIADNVGASAPDCAAGQPVKVAAGALVEDPTGCTLVPLGSAPLLSGDPALLPLQNNGGPTETQALDVGSIARGVLAKAGDCSKPDQRGVARSAPCDLGAFEAP